MEDMLAITLLFGGGSLFLLAISPIGRAIADRIRGAPEGKDPGLADLRESQQRMLEELDRIRGELTDVQERIDFTERLLARGRASGPAGTLGSGEDV